MVQYRGILPWYSTMVYHGIIVVQYHGTVPWYTTVVQYHGIYHGIVVQYHGTVPW